MLKIAIIYGDKNIYIEFTPEKFKELLNKYYKKYKSINKAMNQIEKEIKRESLNK